jgi:hypothetical protein
MTEREAMQRISALAKRLREGTVVLPTREPRAPPGTTPTPPDSSWEADWGLLDFDPAQLDQDLEIGKARERRRASKKPASERKAPDK